jgi:ribosomal protein S4E
LVSLDHIVTQYELESLWVKSALPNVTYTFDTRVRAVAGEHVGRRGRVVALLSTEPSPLYVIEEPEGTSFNAQQTELESIDRDDRPRAQLHLRKSEEEASGD